MKYVEFLTNFWDELPYREKIFVGAGGAAITLFLLYILLVKPVSDEMNDSERALANEKERFERILSLAANAKATSTTNNHRTTDVLPIREAATETSRSIGIAISRIQPGQDGNVSFWVDSATTREMFDWLILLREAHGKTAHKISLHKNVGEETLRGQFEFRGDGE